MSMVKPKFMEEVPVPQGYYEEVDPYKNPPPSRVNLLELSRYAQKYKKKLAELTTREEVEIFTC